MFLLEGRVVRTSAGYGGFSREENIIILEARSLLYAAWYAESAGTNSDPVSQSCACAGALQRKLNIFTMLSVMRRIFASGFRAGFV